MFQAARPTGVAREEGAEEAAAAAADRRRKKINKFGTLIATQTSVRFGEQVTADRSIIIDESALVSFLAKVRDCVVNETHLEARRLLNSLFSSRAV